MEWTRLDSEIESLAQNIAPQGEAGVKIGALIRSSFDMSGDDIFQTPSAQDLAGFKFQDAVVWFEGTVGDVDVRLSLNGADPNAGAGADNVSWPPSTGVSGLGSAVVQDAYGRWNLNESFRVYMGQFKCPVLMSSQVWQGNLIMIDRTRLGQMFDVWQPGAALTYDIDALHLKVAVQNGADGTGDEFGMVARGEYNLNGGAKDFEGAYGSGGDTKATIGVAYFNDSSQIGGNDLGSALALDGYADFGGISVHAEIMDMDEELAGNMGLSGTGSDAMPYSATVGYMLPSEKIEFALRYQDMDDDISTTSIGGGVNYYSHGHNAKWQFNASQIDNDVDDGMIFQLGLAASV